MYVSEFSIIAFWIINCLIACALVMIAIQIAGIAQILKSVIEQEDEEKEDPFKENE